MKHETDVVKRVVVSIIVALAIGLALTFYVQGSNFFIYKVFAPKYEAVRRQTFEESKSYNQGMIQELQNMQFEYIKAKPEQKIALASIILHRSADYDMNKMPLDLREFIAQLRRNQGNTQTEVGR